MPSKVLISTDKLDNLANAVAAKSAVPVKMTVDGMTEALLNMEPPRSDPVLQDKTVQPTTSNQTITADSGYDGLGTVTVLEVDLQDNVFVEPDRTLHNVTPSSGHVGLESVTVGAIPSWYKIPVGTLPITENGIYEVSEVEYVQVNTAYQDGDNVEFGTAS